MLTLWKESYDQPRQHIQKQGHYFANKGLSSQGYGFSSSHVWTWELDCEESWAPKYWSFWIVVLEKTLESPLDCKEIQPVYSKGDQPWVFFGKNDAKAETPPHVKSWLIGKDPDAGRDWGQEEKGMTENEMAGWHHRLDGREFVWTPGVGDGQGGLECGNSWGCKELDMTEWLNWTEEYLKITNIKKHFHKTARCLSLYMDYTDHIYIYICMYVYVCVCVYIWHAYVHNIMFMHTYILHMDILNFCEMKIHIFIFKNFKSLLNFLQYCSCFMF